MQRQYIESVLKRIESAVEYYEKTAPTVEQWLDDLYRRINSNADTAVLSELNLVDALLEDGLWMQPNYAANRVYKMQDRLGRQTTGHAGF